MLKRARSEQHRAEYRARLAGPPFPGELAYLWHIFGRLSCHRANSGFGPAPIGWQDIDAFGRLSRTRLLPWEIEVLEDLDALYLAPPEKGQGT
jgi:hypothetical protein